jgi:spore germination cell wall hydrolase CwlJ-like protein
MRYIIVALALVPSALNFANQVHHISSGRGEINPPTVSELGEIKCLATMIYGEARGEPELGQIAVAYTAVNRAVNRTICDVVLAPMQYSIFNDNPALRAVALNLHIEPKHKNIIDAEAWTKALAVAQAVLKKEVPDPTKGSTHYLSPNGMEALGYEYPEWSKEYKRVAVIHGHQFYKPQKKQIKLTVAMNDSKI